MHTTLRLDVERTLNFLKPIFVHATLRHAILILLRDVPVYVET